MNEETKWLLCPVCHCESYGFDLSAAVGLLVAAGILMMLAGVLFVFLQMWRYTAMLLIGAFGCFVAALNFRNR